MDLSTNLTHDLAALVLLLPPSSSTPLRGEPDALTRSVRLLHEHTGLAVSSLLGLSMTVTVHGQDVVLTSMDARAGSATITSSLLVPLSTLSIPAAGRVVFYAGTRGAFVDLAADLTYALDLDHDDLVLDQHLTPQPVSGITGARRLSLVNIAIGILIDRGHSFENAERELYRRAAESHLELHEAADQLVGETNGTAQA